MADQQDEVKQDTSKPPVMGKIMDGVVNGLTSLISHGSTEAAAALFAGNSAFVMYGPGLTSDQSLESNTSSLDSLKGNDNSLASLEGGSSGPLGSLEPPQEQDLSNGLER